MGPSNGAPGSGELSELEVALLALLSIRPMTDEILWHHARALEPWWILSHADLPQAAGAAEARLIEHEYVVQESKPNKRLSPIGPAAGPVQLAGQHDQRARDAAPDDDAAVPRQPPLDHEETSRLLTAYRDRMAARAESFRQARERFSGSLRGPYRDSVLCSCSAWIT